MSETERADNSHQSVMIDFFNTSSYDLLQSIIVYLRQQLKVPEYSQMFEDNEEFKHTDFEDETRLLF